MEIKDEKTEKFGRGHREILCKRVCEAFEVLARRRTRWGSCGRLHPEGVWIQLSWCDLQAELRNSYFTFYYEHCIFHIAYF